jgi:hypothetical protein
MYARFTSHRGSGFDPADAECAEALGEVLVERLWNRLGVDDA